MENSVELIGTYGDDTLIAMAAWTSTLSELTDERKNRVPDFVVQLAKDKHTVPFEHTLLQFRFHTDLATQIQVMKHRIGVSMSSQSWRWKEQKRDEGYIPADWDDASQEELCDFQLMCFEKYHSMIERLVERGLDRKRAKETSRYFIPYSTMMEYIVTMNFHSFAKFFWLRADEHAQKEIRDLALIMGYQVWATHKFDAALRGWGIMEVLEGDAHRTIHADVQDISGWQINGILSSLPDLPDAFEPK